MQLLRACLVASDTSIKATLEPVKLIECASAREDARSATEELYTGTTQRGETVSGSSCGGEFGSGGARPR
jgi:hypothetical protein